MMNAPEALAYVSYRDRFLEVISSWEEGAAGVGTLNSVELWVAWARFYAKAQAWAKVVLDGLEVPPPKAKSLELAVRALNKTYGRGKEPPGGIVNWWSKNQKSLDTLNDALRWPERVAGAATVGGFTLHNTIGASEAELKVLVDYLERVPRALAATGLPGASTLAYGDVLVVGTLRQSKTLAWYEHGTDKIYLRAKMPKGAADSFQTLMHELGHRYWQKKTSREEKTEWLKYDYALRNKGDLRIDRIEPGFVLPFIVNSKTVRVKEYRVVGGLEKVILEDIKTSSEVGSTGLFELSKWMLEWTRRAGFPSAYASTDPEEHFCEAFSMKAVGSLTPDHLAEFKRVWGLR